MTGDVNVGTVNIEKMVVAPGAAGDWDFLREELDRGVEASDLHDIDPSVPEEVDEPDDTPTPEEQAEIDQTEADRIEDMITDEMIAADIRSDSLHLLVKELDKTRSMEGFQANHEREPRDSWKVGRKRTKERLKGEETLARACAHCLFQNDCWLRENLHGWLDVHPYKEGHKGERRPGSKRVKEVETRLHFIDVIRENPQAHCDPAKRK